MKDLETDINKESREESEVEGEAEMARRFKSDKQRKAVMAKVGKYTRVKSHYRKVEGKTRRVKVRSYLKRK